ncbi:cbb3-type cytochrome oxidase assembly protein CcoS [Marinimicrobium sp. C2-29]|uniref:cbb3-type cytochrome oxidase assembly protein CcoS n=1 Tax=Marinimicrobium sp. C2-29 TaxID=3139825 RepID=UPI003139E6EF
MESLYLLVPIALIFVAIALKIFFWAIRSGQYDNLDTEAHRILFDDDEVPARSPREKGAESEGKQDERD